MYHEGKYIKIYVLVAWVRVSKNQETAPPFPYPPHRNDDGENRDGIITYYFIIDRMSGQNESVGLDSNFFKNSFKSLRL